VSSSPAPAQPAQAHPAQTVPAAPAPADPCRGTALTVAEVSKHCRVERADLTPPQSALAISVAPVEARSGEPASATVAMRNATGAPLELSLRPYAMFSASLFRGDQQVDEVFEEPALGGLLGCFSGDSDCRPIRLILEPNGVLSAKVRIPTRVTRYVHPPPRPDKLPQAMTPTDAGPIPAGDYRAVIELPWSDKTGEHASRRRSVETVVHMTP
jgi:hypothetical protein